MSTEYKQFKTISWPKKLYRKVTEEVFRVLLIKGSV